MYDITNLQTAYTAYTALSVASYATVNEKIATLLPAAQTVLTELEKVTLYAPYINVSLMLGNLTSGINDKLFFVDSAGEL